MDRHIAPQDTICAVATPIGEGGIGIIKISGPDALSIAASLFRSRATHDAFEPFRLHHGWIHDPSTGEAVDEVLLATMPGPRSYTGEDVVEVNCHSGFALLERILSLVLAQGPRLAEPGEFTRRAFLNGRLDLTQAEAVIDLIHSRARRGLEAATRQLAGGMREIAEDLRDRILAIEAQLEAVIDFPEDLEEDASPEFPALDERIEEHLISLLRQWIVRHDEGRVLREGVKLVLAGKPNVGKSSLLNALVGRDRAIVTPVPGTPRDVVEDTFLLSGVLVRVLDTAGLRPSPDPIEALGMERTRGSLEEADLILWVLDQSQPLTEEDEAAWDSIANRRHLLVLNKADLPAVIGESEVRSRFGDDSPAISLSALAPEDILRLRDTLEGLLLRRPLEALGSSVIPNLRHRIHFQAACDALERAVETLRTGKPPEVTALELRVARREIEAILGLDGDEAVLDQIFSRFCIGK